MKILKCRLHGIIASVPFPDFSTCLIDRKDGVYHEFVKLSMIIGSLQRKSAKYPQQNSCWSDFYSNIDAFPNMRGFCLGLLSKYHLVSMQSR